MLAFQPAPVTEPIASFAKNSAVVGFDFAPRGFGDFAGDAFIGREGDFGFTVANGIPKEGHDIVRVEFLRPTGTRVSIFAQNVNPRTGEPGGQAFVIGVDGINRPVDAKFGPDGALYLVDIGAIRDDGATGAGVLDPAHAPFVQIPGTGVIWRISFQ